MPTSAPLLGGLVLVIATLGAPVVGAEESVRLAQAGEPGGAAPPSERTPRQAPPDSDIEEIVVVGTESEAGADFASGDSVTGFGAEDLAALGAEDIADLASFTPNLEIVTSGATTPTFFIRGVGLNDFNPNSTGAVAIYQDDVAINAPALQLGTLFDTEAVNILRGPQGTGLARNASAGAIKVYSRKPSGDFGGYLRADHGNFDYQDYEGAVEAPIYQDLLAARLAFRLSKRDGTMKNRCAGAPLVPEPNDGGREVEPPHSICGEPVPSEQVTEVPPGLAEYVNDTDNWAARGTLLFQPTLDMTWLVNGHGSRRDELSRLGQSIGTGGSVCEGDVICQSPFIDNQGNPLPPELIDEDAVRRGILGGGVDGSVPLASYIPREIRARRAELAPCLEQAGGCVGEPIEERFAANRAQMQIAHELAEELDSEPWEGDFNRTGPTRNDTWGGYLKGDIVLPGALGSPRLSTTTAFDTYERIIDIDLDFSPETLFQIVTEDEAWQAYQDVKLEGELGDALPLRWEVGGWALREELEASVDIDLGRLQFAGVGRRDYTQESWSAGGYGFFAFDFWDDFTLDGGVRYNWDQKSLDMTIFSAPGPGGPADNCTRSTLDRQECQVDQTWQAPTGTLRLTYRFREDTHAFWKYTRGWKPGSINATASEFSGPTVAEPETIDSFETGLRGSWFDRRLAFDGSFFFYSYSDYQIFTARQFAGGTPEFVILNANDAEVYGAEIDAVARPWLGAFVNVRFSWLETQFLDFVTQDQFPPPPGSSIDQDIISFKERQNSGNPLLNSPRFKVSITAEQSASLGRYGSLTLRYDGVWQDITYYDPSEGVGLGNFDGDFFLPEETIAQTPYWLHNLRLSWRAPNGRVEIAGWVRNLANEAYKTFAFDGSTFRRTTIYFVGDPRTYGISAAINF